MPRKISFLVFVWLLTGFAGLAQTFSAVVSFGDSLSDTTNNPAVGDYWEGRYSNGPLWDEYLAADLGATLYDYAFSGSESSDLARQVAAANAVAWNETNTLFTVWSGANDFIDNAVSNGVSITDWSATVSRGVNNIGNAVSLLATAGARFVAVLNLPDLGTLPAVRDNPALAPDASVIRDLAQGFNNELAGTLAAVAQRNPNLRIISVDDFSLLDHIVGDPAGYGFTMVTNDALDVLGDPAFTNSLATNFLFWDVIHPTTKADALVAQLAEQALPRIAPTLIAGPESQTVAVGSQVEFSANAQNATAYQWLFNGKKIKGATNATYVIGSATVAKAGAYAVIVSDPYGGTQSAAAKLKVDKLPKFVVNPHSQNGIAGKKVILSGAATGSSPITYQWQFGGTNLAGATKAVLLLTDLTTNETGPYEIVAMNPVGAVTSKVAMLNVIVPPSIISQPQIEPIISVYGAPIGSQIIVVAAGTPPLRYQWELNGVPLAHETNQSINFFGFSLGPIRSGKFRALIRNAGGSVLSSNVVASGTITPP